MHVMFGENIAVKAHEIKEKDTRYVGNENTQEYMDEQVKKVARDCVVLELTKSGLEASHVEKIDETVLNKEETEEKNKIENNQELIATPKKILENINI